MGEPTDLPRPFPTPEAVARIIVVWLVIGLLASLGIIACLAVLPSRGLRARIFGRYAKALGPMALALLGTRVVVHGAQHLPTHEPAIYVANHTSTLDHFLRMAICPLGTTFVTKRQIVLMPLHGLLFVLGGQPLVARRDRRRDVKTLTALATFARRQALSIWISPEGTRSPDGRLQPFKKGVVHLALATGYPIVPLAIVGAHRLLPARTTRIAPGTVTIHVLPPIETAAWSADNVAGHLDGLATHIRAALPHDMKPLRPDSA